jgi:hypothetical protein
LKAKNSETGDQTTTWVYGTTLSDSDVARNDLVRAKEFPDKSGPSDRVEYKYNRLGEVREIKDQIGTVRVLQYDKLGRELHDRVTTLGSGVDGAVRRKSLAMIVDWKTRRFSARPARIVEGFALCMRIQDVNTLIVPSVHQNHESDALGPSSPDGDDGTTCKQNEGGTK